MGAGMIFKKILSGLNVEPIKRSLLNNPQLWDQNPQRRIGQGSPHSEMTDIWVRFGDTANGDFSASVAEHDSIWYPSADVIEGAKRIAFDVMAAVDGERLGGILITKLPAGGRIHPHSDSGWHAEYYEKFYVALQAPKGSAFGFESGDIVANDGDCWYFRNDVTHWVTNDSDQDRISMIICIKTEKFRSAA
jgi:hypothetical protein